MSSRAAIFEDDFQSEFHHHKHATPHSNRTNDPSEDDEDDDEELSKSILAKLYGQLEGAMEIEEEDSPRIATSMSGAKEKDPTHTFSQQDETDQETNEDSAMEFRLFATQDTPTKISLVHKPAQEVTQLLEATHRLRREVDENPGSERMQQIKEAAIDAMTVLEQAKIPWVRRSDLNPMRKTVFLAEKTLLTFFFFLLGQDLLRAQSHPRPLPPAQPQQKDETQPRQTRVG